jgi:hypothetical protein
MRAPARGLPAVLAVIGRAVWALPAVLAVIGWAAGVAAGADAATVASIHPSFLPDRLGAGTAFTLALRFSGGEEGVPAPVRTIVLRLPAGLGIDLRGVGTCPTARLRREGPAGCPAGSLLGRGHAVLEVHAGSQTIPEQSTLWAFHSADVGGRPAMAIFGQGNTPLQRQTISTGVLTPAAPPYGYELTVSIPAIPTLVYEPDASFASLSLTIGRLEGTPRAHAAAGAITVPRSCPSGGFPFAAAFTFAGGSTAAAIAAVACP